MTDVAPPPRRRPAPAHATVPAINPTPRSRPGAASVSPAPVSPPPRRRAPVAAEAAPPIKMGMRAHNRIEVFPGEVPDPRFAPMVIVVQRGWLKECPGYVAHKADLMSSWTPETDFTKGDNRLIAVNALLTEICLRCYLRQELLGPGVMAALVKCVAANPDMWNDAQRSMLKIEGELVEADLTINTGPYIMDSCIAIEAHYKLRPHHPKAA